MQSARNLPIGDFVFQHENELKREAKTAQERLDNNVHVPERPPRQ